jgi:hypothetical protein
MASDDVVATASDAKPDAKPAGAAIAVRTAGSIALLPRVVLDNKGLAATFALQFGVCAASVLRSTVIAEQRCAGAYTRKHPRLFHSNQS